jgi:hypothetical protein
MVLNNNQCLLLAVILVILLVVCVFLAFGKFNKHSTSESFSEDKLQRNINPPWAMNRELDSVIYKIAQAIVKNVNQRLTTNYILGQFENVVEDYDNDGNKRYVMDFFVYKLNNQAVNDVSRRLIVDLTLFHNTRTIQINTINFSNAMKKPEENNNIRDNNNSDNKLLILSEDALLKEKNQDSPMRFTFNEVLESDPFENPKPIDITDTDRRPWILPLQIQDKSMAQTRAFPCQDYGNWWDKNGIPLTAEQEKGLPPSDKPKWCYNSYNTATVPQTIVAQRFPQFVKMPYDQADKTNNWMFDKMQGIPSFPHGSS